MFVRSTEDVSRFSIIEIGMRPRDLVWRRENGNIPLCLSCLAGVFTRNDFWNCRLR